MAFHIRALDPAPFAPLFQMSDSELEAQLARRETATHSPGFPCRVSLQDATVGEEVLLVHYEHQDAATPFRASHAIYVRRGAEQAEPEPDTVPEFLRVRTLSVRAFSGEGMILSAKVVAGEELAAELRTMLSADEVSYLHLHSAAMGCYLARAERV